MSLNVFYCCVFVVVVLEKDNRKELCNYHKAILRDFFFLSSQNDSCVNSSHFEIHSAVGITS